MKSREKRKRCHPVALALADHSGSRRPAADYFECPNPQSPFFTPKQSQTAAVEAVAKMELTDFNLTLEKCSKVLARLCLRMGFRQTLQDLGDFFHFWRVKRCGGQSDWWHVDSRFSVLMSPSQDRLLLWR